MGDTGPSINDICKNVLFLTPSLASTVGTYLPYIPATSFTTFFSRGVRTSFMDGTLGSLCHRDFPALHISDSVSWRSASLAAEPKLYLPCGCRMNVGSWNCTTLSAAMKYALVFRCQANKPVKLPYCIFSWLARTSFFGQSYSPS